jgi:hypothetical protein
MVNYVFKPNGLRSFNSEIQKSSRFVIHGKRIPVLPLHRIRASKLAAGRPKDEAHIKLIDETLRCKKAVGSKKR